MIKNSLYAAMLLCGASSMAIAGPVVLEAAQMDAVTAGVGPIAGGQSLALGVGAFVFTGTNANTHVAAQSVGGPQGGSYNVANLAVADSVGVASAFGPTAGVVTSASTSAAVPDNALVIGLNVHRQVGGTSISGSAIAVYGTVQRPIFR